MTTVVTSGSAYTDIDAFACALALAEALQIAGHSAIAWLPGKPNLTIPAKFRKHIAFQRTCPDQVTDLILVDVSDPDHIPIRVSDSPITAVFDHHFGFEEFWAKSNTRAMIEPIGAAATLIWEEAQRLSVADKLSKHALMALGCAIVSNTADFLLPMTTARDRLALEEIEYRLGYCQDWRGNFLEEIDKTILANIEIALATDTKLFCLSSGSQVSIGQIEVQHDLSAFAALAGVKETGIQLPDIVIVAARENGRTSLVTTDMSIAENIASHYGFPLVPRDNLITCTLTKFLLRKMILPSIDQIFRGSAQYNRST